MSTIAVACFGGGALLLFSAVYFFFDRGRRPRGSAGDPQGGRAMLVPVRPFNITFARLFGLITVAVLGVLLAWTGVNDQLASAAFTLLGTIAGYLAGAKATSSGSISTSTAGAAQPAPGGPPITTATIDEPHL